MILHRRQYFWMRAIFQIIAFGFLIVTLLMLINFESDYWHSSMAMLVTKHCFDMVGISLDLLALSSHKVDLIKFKIPFDFISIILILIV